MRPLILQDPNSLLLLHSKIPKKGFVEVTELTDVTYTSNLVRLRPGHMNVVLILSSSTKTSLLQKFALEVYTFTR